MAKVPALLRQVAVALTPRPKAYSMPSNGRGGWISIIREGFAGAWQHNVVINRAEASAFYVNFSCQTLIARDIAKLGLRLVQKDGDGIWTEISSPTLSPVLQDPNHYQTHNQFWESWILSKLHRGNTYVLKGRDNRRVVTALYVLNPDRVQPLIADDGSVFYQLSTDTLNGLPNQVIVPATEIIHDRMNCLDHPLIGVPPIMAAALAAQQGLNIQKESIRLFGNRSTPGGILSASGHIEDDTAERIKREWEDGFGNENRGRTAVLGDGLKFERMSLTAEEAELIEQLKWTGEVVCSVYHVPSYMVGVGPEPATGSAQERTLRYYTQALQSLIEDAESALDRGLGLGDDIGVEFDVDNLLRMDTVAQMDALDKGKNYFTPNEGRKKLNLRPKPGGDAVYRQQQDFSLEALAKRDATDNPFLASPSPAKGALRRYAIVDLETGTSVVPAASGESPSVKTGAGGQPGDVAGSVARPRSTPTTVVHIEGELNDALCTRVLAEIAAAPGPVDLHVNSNGGMFVVAMAICEAIEEHPAPVTTIIRQAKSGAALIAMAGDRRCIHAGGSMFIHEPFSGRTGVVLEEHSAVVAKAISGYSGWSTNISRSWMRQEETFTADEAKRAGFVDCIIDPAHPAALLTDGPAEKRQPSEWLRHQREMTARIKGWERA